MIKMRIPFSSDFSFLSNEGFNDLDFQSLCRIDQEKISAAVFCDSTQTEKKLPTAFPLKQTNKLKNI